MRFEMQNQLPRDNIRPVGGTDPGAARVDLAIAACSVGVALAWRCRLRRGRQGSPLRACGSSGIVG
jgi:hypothetical protein